MNISIPPRLTFLRLFLPLLLAALALTGLVWGLGAVTSAQAVGSIRYVDGASGSDTGDCANPAAPCATIQYAINQSPPGDEIRVAEGTYTETIGIGVSLTLKGGYEATGWTRDIAANSTVIDANGADASVVNISPGSPGASITVEGFTIQGANHISDSGGGFFINDAAVVISATIVQNNHTSGSGGGASIEGADANVSFINSVLTNNSSDGSGGAICCGIGQTLTLDNTKVRGNAAQNGGGGLNISSGSVSIINNSQIISNTTANDMGGGIRVQFIPITIANSSLLFNTASNGSGGGLYLDSNSSLYLNNVEVSSNQAAGTGGGIHLAISTATITDSRILSNTANTVGGGLSLDSSTLALTSVLVQDNQVIGSGVTSGGGINSSNSSLTLNDSVIENNVVQSTDGGETLGGALNTGSDSVEILNTIIRSNNSQGTPAVQMWQSVFTVTNSLVVGNLGPAFDGSPTQATFTNVTIADNNGWGLGVYSPPPEDPQFDVNVTVVNSILWGNSGFDYSCSVPDGMGSCTLSYSDVGVGDTTGTGNISADPWFVDPSAGDYHLQAWSPAIDAGTPVGAPDHDFEGDPRPQNAGFDMGADEFVGATLPLYINIHTDADTYAEGDTMTISLDIVNQGPTQWVRFRFLLRTPWRMMPIVDKPLVLPADFSYSKLFSWTLPGLPPATYAWVGMLIPTGGAPVVDTAVWTFTGSTSSGDKGSLEQVVDELRGIEINWR